MSHAPRFAVPLLVVALALGGCQPPKVVETATPTTMPSTPTVAPRTVAPRTVAPRTVAPPPSATPTPPPPPPSPTPTPAAAYPLPAPVEVSVPTAYPAPAEAEVVQGRSIAILALQPGARLVQVSGSTSLPEDACLQTWLYANGKLVAWWPSEACAAIRAGRWVLGFERPALVEQTPPGARYTVIAKSLAHPEAGEARLVLQAFIPYHASDN